MKNYTNKVHLVALVMSLGLLAFQNVQAKKDKTITHSVFIAGPEFTGIIDEQGGIV
jgi:hypothetical protein